MKGKRIKQHTNQGQSADWSIVLTKTALIRPGMRRRSIYVDVINPVCAN